MSPGDPVDPAAEGTASSERPHGRGNRWSEEFWRQAFQSKNQGVPEEGGDQGAGLAVSNGSRVVPALPEQQPEASQGPSGLISASAQLHESPVKGRRAVQEQLGAKRSPLQATRDFWEQIARGNLVILGGRPSWGPLQAPVLCRVLCIPGNV